IKEAIRYLKALLTKPKHFKLLLELTNNNFTTYIYIISLLLIYYLYTSSSSFNANALGLLALE
ncbi:hypothetical protein BDW02DRAFT_508275, partial [Decorospora gaudefroyi]